MKAMADMLLIRHSLTTAYHPQGNAYAERIHKFINNALSQCVNNDQNDWDDIVSCIMIAHNDCVHAANGVSPAEVILGRHLNLPGEEINEHELSYSPKSYAQKLKWILAKTQEIVQGKMALKIA
jgi:transposase InsO family protein